MENLRIAILITSYNRVEKTKQCLLNLYNAVLPEKFFFEVYLVDDNSPDLTGDIIKKEFPEVRIIKGDGNLFWGGGTNLAWESAQSGIFDFYLWLNDDTLVFPSFWKTFQKAVLKLNHVNIILVGTTVSEDKFKISYGGYNENGVILPNGELLYCDYFNGNCVFISQNVFRDIGYIDKCFTHTIGDFDYGLRARKKEVSCFVLPDIVGVCEKNNTPDWCNPAVSFKKRLKAFNSVKGLKPEQYFLFIRRHYPREIISQKIKVYFRLYFPKLWANMKTKKKMKW